MLGAMPLVFANLTPDVDGASATEFDWLTDDGNSRMLGGDWTALLTAHDPVTGALVLTVAVGDPVTDPHLIVDEAVGRISVVLPADSLDTTEWSRTWCPYRLVCWPVASPGLAELIAEGIVTVRRPALMVSQ